MRRRSRRAISGLHSWGKDFRLASRASNEQKWKGKEEGAGFDSNRILPEGFPVSATFWRPNQISAPSSSGDVAAAASRKEDEECRLPFAELINKR